MILRNLDKRFKACLEDLIQYQLGKPEIEKMLNNLELLVDPKSYLKQAERIRDELSNMADPDAIEVIAAMGRVYKDITAEVQKNYPPETADRLLYEISKLRKGIGMDQRKRKSSSNGRPPLTR